MKSHHPSRLAHLGIAVAAIAAAPVVLGTSALSAGAPAVAGAVHADLEGPIVGPDGAPVVERQVVGDVVIDWLEEPPADAGAPHGQHAHEEGEPVTAEGTEGHAPTVVLAAGSAGGEGGVASGQGFTAISPTARWLPSGYTVRLAGPDGRVEEFRDELASATSAASAAAGIPVRFSSARGGSPTPSTGEITVVLEPARCGSPAYGCGGPTLQSNRIVAGRVWIDPAALRASATDRQNLAAHELAHALGLHHYSGTWTDGRQAMHPTLSRITTYREGDRRGLRYMAGGFDRASGGITELRYAAGQLRVAGTLASGSRVRVSSGSATKDVTASAGRFSAELPAPAGRHRVCVAALDPQPGFSPQIGCAETTAPGAPVGSLELVENSFRTITVRGWALDPQTASPVSVEIRRNGRLVATEAADASRADVGRAHPDYGPDHGFDLDVPGVSGGNEICVRIRGVGAGGDTDLGCRRVTHSVMPIGAFRARATDVGVTFQGWALDPNTPAPIDLRVTVDGKVPATPGQFRASEPRPDVAARYPQYGHNHGFDQSVALAPGQHEVCLTIVNVGAGKDRTLGCLTVRVDTATALARRGGIGPTASVTAPATQVVTGVVDAAGSILGN